MTKYTKEEQQKHREELVKALRSGEYQQAHKKLRVADSFCCLGVACDISGLGKWNSRNLYLETRDTLPKRVMDYYGFVDNVGGFTDFTRQTSLMEINDNGISFNRIADVIEFEPLGMFE